METYMIRLLIITSACSFSQRYVHVDNEMSWPDAQDYCKTSFTDLSPVSNEEEEQLFEKFANQKPESWIGLHRDPDNSAKWKWSGGAYIDETFKIWEDNANNDEIFATWKDGQWKPKQKDKKEFFCLNLIVVEERKTWEEALEDCRENQTEFTSLLSETEMLLVLRDMRQSNITEPVWIGLRYLQNHWLWVNGDPLVYQAWSDGDEEQQCPRSNGCGVLTQDGLWKTWDCADKLNYVCIGAAPSITITDNTGGGGGGGGGGSDDDD